jgi:hypothetical protein
VLFLPQGLESLGPKIKRLFAGRPDRPDRPDRRQLAGEPSRD